MNNKHKQKLNYFKAEEAKKAAKYKLWLAIKPQFVSKWHGKRTMVYFGFNKRKENGLDWLLNKAKFLRDDIIEARIYDQTTDTCVYKIPGTNASLLAINENEG